MIRASCSILLLSWGAIFHHLVIVGHALGGDHVESAKCSCDEAQINRQGFPNGFKFGCASSAYQIEGGYNANGKGLGLWDNYTHAHPERILDHSNGDVAADSYHLYKEDVRLLKNMNVDSYKFSINWARILPGGTRSKGVNQDGIDYYNNLINELLDNGIEPWVTILHLDYPQALEDAYGGFLSKKVVDDFQDFADVLFAEFGDRVKYWITINEPWGLSDLAYAKGIFAPGRCSSFIRKDCVVGDSGVEPYIVNHNQLLAHAAVVDLYRNNYQEKQKGQIGITVNSFWFVPYDETDDSLKAADRAIEFMLGWEMDPIVFGRYPLSMQERVGSRLPKFSEEEAQLLKGSFDFIGLNYYTSSYARNAVNITNVQNYLTDSGAEVLTSRDGVPIGPRGSTIRYNYIYPKGLRELLRYIKERYGDLLIYITENAMDSDNNIPMSSAIQDYKRKDNFYDHLCCLREAIEKDGANVKGFFSWSLMDDYVFTTGYMITYGLHYVDFSDKDRKRYPKVSALWFRSILEGKIADE